MLEERHFHPLIVQRDCMLGRIDLRSRTGESIRISCLWPVCLGVQFQLELFNFLHERVHCWRLFPSESWQSSFNASVLCQKVICRFWTNYVDDPGNVMTSWYIHKTCGSSLSFFSYSLFLSVSFSLSVTYHEAMFYSWKLKVKRYVTMRSYHSVTYHTYVTDLLWELSYDMFLYYSGNILVIKFSNI